MLAYAFSHSTDTDTDEIPQGLQIIDLYRYGDSDVGSTDIADR